MSDANVACCAHLHVSFRTEEVERYVEPTEEYPGGLRKMTRGWWECDSGCGAHFAWFKNAEASQ